MPTLPPSMIEYLGQWGAESWGDSERVEEIISFAMKMKPEGQYGGRPAAKPLREGQVRPVGKLELKRQIREQGKTIAKLQKQIDKLTAAQA